MKILTQEDKNIYNAPDTETSQSAQSNKKVVNINDDLDRNFVKRRQTRNHLQLKHYPHRNVTETQDSASSSLPLAINSKKLQTFKTRLTWTIILVVSFLVILAAGHFYVSLLVLLLTTLVYREVIALKRNIEKDTKLPLFFVLRWYFFALTVYGTGYFWIVPIGTSLNLFTDQILQVLEKHHFIIMYTSGFVGLVLFLMSLHRFSLTYQFSQFALLVLTCLFVVGQAMFQIKNIYSGLGWFIISSSAVIVNDVSAYVCGMLYGKTRLTKLSPNKTIEGFLGASAITLLWTMVLSKFLFRYDVFICPVNKIYFRPFIIWKDIHCDNHAVFHNKTYMIPTWLKIITGINSVYLKPAWLHSIVLGCFAAFFAPFGGFFASAVKRSLKVKDFGASIPGHGGITDRFDCQLIMGMFTYLYLRTFVFFNKPTLTVDHVIQLIGTFPHEDQLRIIRAINPYSMKL